MSGLGLEIRRLRLSLPMAPIQRLHYSEAQARGRRPPSMYGQRLKTKRAPDRADAVLQGFALTFSDQPYVPLADPGRFNASLALPAPTGISPAPAAQ
jgi:hypothetical protein